jgi:hypothetical protein
MESKCRLPAATQIIALFFLALAGIFGLVTVVYYLNHRYLVAVECQSSNISVTLETCYTTEPLWVTGYYPYTGRIYFCFPVLYWFGVGDVRNITFCHWKQKTCGLTSEQLKADLSSQYPLRSYTPCWYWNDSNVEGSLSYYPVYLKERYTDYGILFIVTCVCLGIVLLVLILGALCCCVKKQEFNSTIQ